MVGVLAARGASARLFEILEREEKIPLSGGVRPKQLSGDVALEGVTFSYPSRSDIKVLRDYTLNVPANSTAALVGSSGSGKSTVIALLARFYDAEGGQIMIDGVDIKDLDPLWLHDNIALVLQEVSRWSNANSNPPLLPSPPPPPPPPLPPHIPDASSTHQPVLFGMSVKDNIVYGLNRGVTDDEVVEACKKANAHDFVEGFPEKYATMVGERGMRLSGGQKQRLAIARALLVNPRILLLDEATSALDAESEHVVQDAIDKLMVGRTTIVVAHRLSTVRNADKIVVFDQGTCVDEGTHDELMGRCEKYVDLVQRQTDAGAAGGEKEVSTDQLALEVAARDNGAGASGSQEGEL